MTMLAVALLLVLHAASAQPTTRPFNVEVNVLWPIFPGNLYSAKALYTVYKSDKSAGQVYLGFSHRPYEFRDDEGDFSNSAVLFGYRQYLKKGFNIEWYNALGPGRLNNSVVNGQDYRSTDYEIGLLLGYTFEFLQNSKTPLYVNLQPVGVAYLAYQSDPHPIVGQDDETPFYFGAIPLGIKF